MNKVQQFTATGMKHQIYPWFNAVADLVGDARINITDTGIYIVGVDLANVAMINIHISPDQFETYKTTADNENPLTLGINFIRYAHIMKKRHIKNKSQFSFEVLPPHKPIPDSMVGLYDISSKYLPWMLFGVDDISFEYVTLAPASIRKEPQVPKLDLPIELAVPLDELCNMLHALGSAGIDHMLTGVDFTDVNNPNFIMSGETGDNELVSRSIPMPDLPYLKATHIDSVPTDPIICSLQSCDHLNPIVSCLKLFDSDGVVRITLGKDMPITISMDFEGKSNITYILAPRIESE